MKNKKIKIGDYVRIVQAQRSMISKVYDIQKGKSSLIDKKIFCMIEGIEEWFTSDDIVKHSSNILDVLEEGDYVNGDRVLEIQKVPNEKIDRVIVLNSFEDSLEDEPFYIYKENVVNILTHEMYEKKCFKLKKKVR